MATTDARVATGARWAGGFPPLRLAVGLGDPDLERRLLPALSDAGDVAVVQRCLSADELLGCVQRGPVDVVLAAHDLHRLGAGALAELGRARVPIVLLAPGAADERWRGLPAVVLPLDADAQVVRDALEAATRGERSPATVADEPDEVAERAHAGLTGTPGAVGVLAIGSGHGSPGRTTLAVSLAAALGAVAPTVLVDADVSGPSVAGFLDADPTRNIYMIAHREPQTTRDWDQLIARETQPLGRRSPRAAVLCGVPKVEMRSGVTRQFVEQLIGELRRHYRYVVVDVGAELLGAEVGVHRSALMAADHVLLVASPDVVGLHHARRGIELLQGHLAIPAERVALVVNRHDRRHHHARAEIEWALGAPMAAQIPYDHRAAQRALTAQCPLAYERRSPAAGALVELAGRVHGGTVVLPPEPGRDGRPAWRRLVPSVGRLRPWRAVRATAAQGGTPDGHDVVVA